MGKKEISISTTTIRNFFIAIILGFLSLYFIEHKGTISFYYGKGYNDYDSTYANPDTPIGSIFFMTAFDKKIDVPRERRGEYDSTKGRYWKNTELYHTYDSDFHKYSNKMFIYIDAVKADYLYGFFFALIWFAILSFFTIFKFKIKKA